MLYVNLRGHLLELWQVVTTHYLSYLLKLIHNKNLLLAMT
jgi:hypothetical protein